MYVYGVQIEAALPTLFIKAMAAARLAGGRGSALEIQAKICYSVSQREPTRDVSCTDRRVHAERKVQQEQAEILWTKAIRKHEDEASNHNNRNRIHPKPVPIVQLVRGEAVPVGVENREDVRWRNEEKCDDMFVRV